MKNILKIAMVAFPMAFIGCDEPETEVIPFKPVVYKEIFDTSSNDFIEDTYLTFNGWTSIAETGTVEWTEQDDDNNGSNNGKHNGARFYFTLPVSDIFEERRKEKEGARLVNEQS